MAYWVAWLTSRCRGLVASGCASQKTLRTFKRSDWPISTPFPIPPRRCRCVLVPACPPVASCLLAVCYQGSNSVSNSLQYYGSAFCIIMVVGTASMTKNIGFPTAILAALCSSSLPRSGWSFVRAPPSMASTTTFSPRGLDRIDDRPAPFVTASASGSTIESALGSLGTLVRRKMGEKAHLAGEGPPCKIGVLFYNDDEVAGGEGRVRDALAGFHGCLPFIDQIIGKRDTFWIWYSLLKIVAPSHAPVLRMTKVDVDLI